MSTAPQAGQQVVRAELPSTPTSVRQAREVVRQALAPWPHLQDTAALLVSELATNALLHTESDLLVEVGVRAGAVRIGVSDTSPVLPRRKRHSAEAGTGRGLGLVALLSTASGVDQVTGGAYRKTVWCELPVDPAALPAPGDGALVA